LQIPIIKEFLKIIKVQTIEEPTVEADDIIATLSKKREKEGKETIIYSADKDFFQLLSPQIIIFDPLKKKYITEEDFIKEKKFLPEQFKDYLSLVGDSSDNSKLKNKKSTG
jgi:DNA polymerase I